MKEENKKQKPSSVRRRYWFLAILFSLLFHFALLYELGQKSIDLPSETSSIPEGYIKFDVPKKEKITKKDEEDENAKRILEAPLLPTQKPPNPDFLGQTDHQAKKLMKVKRRDHEKAADPGIQKSMVKSTSKTPPSIVTKGKEIPDQEGKDQISDKDKPLKEKGTTEIKKRQKRGRNGYEDLLAESTDKLSESEMNQGYMDHLNDLAEEGETIDMNTQEYRFIGYFTNLRKAIELVWVYPSEAAQRGLSGVVIVKFIIMSDGKVSKIQVLDSSGHSMLDSAIVDAIHSAAPFAPLPKGFNKEHLVVRGAFSYVLGSY